MSEKNSQWSFEYLMDVDRLNGEEIWDNSNKPPVRWYCVSETVTGRAQGKEMPAFRKNEEQLWYLGEPL